MMMDGLAMRAVVRELSAALTGGRVDKVFQPDRDLLVLSIRNNGQAHKLLLTCSSQYARIHITQKSWPNPDVPPALCMLLRKRLVGGRVTGVSQPGLERLCIVDLLCSDELGERVPLRLVAEVMGRHSNVILVDNDGVIVDALKRVDEEVSRVRQILPGIPYAPPPAQDKANPLELTAEQLAEVLRSGVQPLALPKTVAARLAGLRADTAEALLKNAGWQPLPFLAEQQSVALAAGLYAQFQMIARGESAPCLVGSEGAPAGFLPFLPEGASQVTVCESMSAALDVYYGEREQRDRRLSRAGALRTTLRNKLERCHNKLGIHMRALDNPQEGDKYRLYGELLTANLYAIKRGQTVATVEDYYHPGEKIDIPLDPKLTPNGNAQRYYKKYAKFKAASEYALNEVETIEAEIRYLESQLVAIAQCASTGELEEVRRELEEQGVLRGPRGNKKRPRVGHTQPKTFASSDGLEIRVGKNNMQNDRLTFKWASPRDIWLHVKDLPGSHVILRLMGTPYEQQPETVPSRSLLEAAMLAVLHSASPEGVNLPVDYTLRKQVKKPAGAKPGMVIYFEQKTLYVTPEPGLATRLG